MVQDGSYYWLSGSSDFGGQCVGNWGLAVLLNTYSPDIARQDYLIIAPSVYNHCLQL